ncbi:MAG: hypothetical protein ACYTAS_02710 [Planctomycetota bacterium]|jgi:Tol biopolymer transport system component
MSHRVKSYSLIAFYLVGTLLAGCFPDNSLVWSSDGSWGLLRVKGALFAVDGKDGELSPIEPEGGVAMMPGISADGSQIAYVAFVGRPNLDEGLRLFPSTMANMIEQDAEQLAQKVLAGLVTPESLLPDNNKELPFAQPYHGWVLRTMCRNPGSALADKLGPDVLAKCQQLDIGYAYLVVAPRTNSRQGKTLVTMPLAMHRPRFSPDGRYVAYVLPLPEDEKRGVLLVASTDGKVAAMEVATGVALGYDWRPDGRALAYVKLAGDTMLGTLEEKVVIDETGSPLVEAIHADEEACVASSRSRGEAKQLAGTLFQPLMHVQYGLDGRMLFSSAALAIPTTELEEPKYSVFCYDRVTGTVKDVLPSVIRNRASQNMNFFRLSPDGTRLLVPLQYNRFAIYELGSNEAIFPCEGDEGYGMDEMPDFVPSWKGNDQIVCMVSEKGHFLVGDDGQAHHRKEVVVLGTDGQLHTILSSRWPDEAIPQTTQDDANEGLKVTP